jgi:Spy/CpxP family protein refolding chaperone
VNTWKVILATMVIFGTGVVTGGLLVLHSERIQPRHTQHQGGAPRVSPPASAGGMRLEFLRRAQRELDLTPEQRERIDKLIKESQERSRKLMEPIAPQLRGELEQTKTEFLEVLTPAQRARFEQLMKQQQQRPHEQRRPAQPPIERPAEPAPPAKAP